MQVSYTTKEQLADLGRYDEVTWFDKALAINPNYFDSLSGKGNAIYDLSQYRHALTIYDKAFAIEPGNNDILKYNIETNCRYKL
ncbi:MAG TPA: hypothetical protein VJ772_06235 [Nitrososphaeraceae archaeon]|nr:hypothetical protein [Nitrososphaeraceae archaeon]